MRGRPNKSIVRQNLIDILFFKKVACGYELHKIYCDIFPKTSRENVYYNLRKGVKLGEFNVEVKKVEGDYSWGRFAEKIFYSLGSFANPRKNDLVSSYFDKKK
jgi:hypothetical protein